VRLFRRRADNTGTGPQELDPADSPEFEDGAFEARLAWILGSPRTGSTWLLPLLAFPLRLSVEDPSGSVLPRRASRCHRSRYRSTSLTWPIT
jgi:hypothetical protein